MEKKILSKRDVGDGVQTTIQLSNRDKSDITTDEVAEIINRLSTNGSKVMVRALNIERWMTLKGMNEDFDPETFIDYYVNKVREEDVQKFTEFKQVQVTVFKLKKRN
jgi:hypothetical protein